MAKIADQYIRAEDNSGESHFFKTTARVDSSGVFYVDFPEDMTACVEQVYSRENKKTVSIFYNTRNRKKCISGPKLDDCVNFLSRSLAAYRTVTIVDEAVIRYRVDTDYAAWLNRDGSMEPNGREATKDGGAWVTSDGSKSSRSFFDKVDNFEIGAYATVARKRTITRGETKEVVIQRIRNGDDAEDSTVTLGSLGPHGVSLYSFSGLNRSFDNDPGVSSHQTASIEETDEMPYTEEAAAFFVDFLLAVAQLAHRARTFFEKPESILAAIESRASVFALPAPGTKS